MGLDYIPHQGRSFLGVTKSFVTSGARSNKQTNFQNADTILQYLLLNSKALSSTFKIPFFRRVHEGEKMIIMV